MIKNVTHACSYSHTHTDRYSKHSRATKRPDKGAYNIETIFSGSGSGRDSPDRDYCSSDPHHYCHRHHRARLQGSQVSGGD